MHDIIQGFRRFRSDVFPTKRQLFAELAKGQNPSAVVICCADSRVDMQLVTQSDPGQLFCFRNAGNIVPPYGAVLGAASATIEYAMEALEIPNIIVCGHSDCGAMKGLLKHDLAERMPTVASWLRFAEVPRQLAQRDRALSEREQLDVLVRQNVLTQLAHLRTHPAVAVRLETGKVRLHGWVYEIERGEIDTYDERQRRFAPLDDVTPLSAAAPGQAAQTAEALL